MNQDELNRFCDIMGIKARWSFKPNGKGGGTSIFCLFIAKGNNVYGKSAVSGDATAAKDYTAAKAWLKMQQVARRAPMPTYHALDKFIEQHPRASELERREASIALRLLWLKAREETLTPAQQAYKEEKYGRNDHVRYRRWHRLHFVYDDENIITAHLYDGRGGESDAPTAN
jgi:hypothetical protein